MAFLFCPGMRGARSLRFDRSDFAAYKRRIFAQNAQKSRENPTGTEQAQLAEYPADYSLSLRPISDCISSLMRPDPALTQMVVKTAVDLWRFSSEWFYR